MIGINLLPHHLRPIKRTPLPYFLCALAFVVAMLWVAISFISIGADIMTKSNTLESTQAQLDSLADTVRQSDKLEQLKLSLADRITAIEAIVSDRITWSEQLWRLSKLTPDNVWYRELKQTTVPVIVRVPKMNTQTKQMEMVPQSQQKPALKISGYVYIGQDGSMSVNPLIDALVGDPDFSSMFTFRTIDSFGEADFEDYRVNAFEMTFLVTPQGNQ